METTDSCSHEVGHSSYRGDVLQPRLLSFLILELSCQLRTPINPIGEDCSYWSDWYRLLNAHARVSCHHKPSDVGWFLTPFPVDTAHSVCTKQQD
eukprot:8771247-Ditylum_brightwellii.AAC.1